MRRVSRLTSITAFGEVASSAGMTGAGEEVDAAPEEIRDAMQTLADGYEEVLAAMAEAGYDPNSDEPPDPETMDALVAAREPISSPEFTAAGEEVSAYFENERGGGLNAA